MLRTMPTLCIPSLELGTNDDLPGQKDLPFNFTLRARYVNGGPGSLPFGFRNLDGRDGTIRGDLASTPFLHFSTGNR